MLRRSLVVSPKDTVAVILEDGHQGDTLRTADGDIVLLEDVEFAHKVAIVDHAGRQPVIKYGHEIGYVDQATPKGSWIHSHNLRCDRGT